MLQVQNLSYAIGGRELLSNVNWNIHPGKRVALIGPNGAGKTTLLRILNGDIEPSTQQIIKPKGYRIGYLPQEEVAVGQGPLLPSVLEGLPEVLALERQIAAIHQALDFQGEKQKVLLTRLGALEARYESLGGYKLETLAKTLLSGLGFKETDFHRPLSELSGGWRMRVYLARLLAQNPDLLLLDEPTNHLDIKSLEWLEQYLKSFPGSMVIVSHDRFFIDRLAQEIAELDRGKLTLYPGRYQFYEKQKALNEERLFKKWEEHKAERERQQKFIDRFRYKASKAAQVQSRIKRLEKMEEIELPPPPRRFSFKIQVEVPSFKDVLQIEKMSFRYDKDWVLEDIHVRLYRGEKVALVGVNGAGKTTLTKLISGQLVPQRGTVQIGQRTTIGYYAQHQIDALRLDATVYEEVASTAATSQRTQLRDVLGLFQFSGDDIHKKIRALSGGEKARVSLAKILLSPVNFLMMDEPTNHLDLSSKEALESALAHYEGTLLLISHDRYFLDKLVNRVLELEDRKLKEYPGNYSDYLQSREKEAGVPQGPGEKSALPSPAQKSKEQKQLEAQARQAISKERNRLKRGLEQLETQISALEKRKIEVEQLMTRPETYQNGEFIASLQIEYSRLKKDLDSLVEKWEEIQGAYDDLMTPSMG